MSNQQPAPLRVAVAGYRHGHINAVIAEVKQRPDTVLVAAADEDAAAREAMIAAEVTAAPFDDYARMLDTVACDVVAVGDYYGRRGALILAALRRGKHVISDKPIGTRLAELAEITTLAHAQHLCVGCQLDMRFSGLFRALRRLVREGALGAIHAVSFEGQHPLLYGKRPGWYFEEGKHGGTLNDIAIHACDYIPWITGQRFTTVNAARNWNAKLPAVPHFHDAAQVMLTMDNGCGVLGDVSYLTPDSFGYALPQYHRTIIWGNDGMAEVSANAAGVTLYRNGEAEPRLLPPDPVPDGSPFDAFLREVRGETENVELTTPEVLRAARVALIAQAVADDGGCNRSIEDE